MNEFEVQTLVMEARDVKPADKFVMICILKNVDWSTWKGSVRLLYITKKYDVKRKTLYRIIQRLKSLNWIKVKTLSSETVIQVNLKTLLNQKSMVKMTHKGGQNDMVKMTQGQNDMVKVTHEGGQNDPLEVVKMTHEGGQNDPHNNSINNNTIDINKEEFELVTKEEAMKYTETQDFNDLSHMCDDRGKVPLHVLKAVHRRYEIERRWAHHKKTIETNVFNERGLYEAFKQEQNREDFKLYGSTAKIKKTWRS